MASPHSMADGILTQQEETLLREFRDRLALDSEGIDRKAAAEIERASTDRLTLDARLAAIAVENPDAHLNELTASLRQSGLNQGQQTALLVRAWEAAVEGTLEDGLLTLDEENALTRYMDHFGITAGQVNQNGVLTTHGPGRRNQGRGLRRRPPAAEHHRPGPLQPDEVGARWCGSWTGSTTWRS